jgi:hypothetical protein
MLGETLACHDSQTMSRMYNVIGVGQGQQGVADRAVDRGPQLRHMGIKEVNREWVSVHAQGLCRKLQRNMQLNGLCITNKRK